MEKIALLNKYGLFDAKVPRYTSYPPANHFENGVGPRHQDSWLRAVPDGAEISVYVHIPFCKRLCWFCACRTQGTRTLRPVDAYVEVLKAEITKVRSKLPKGVKMARLHLGGGTPTILSANTMRDFLGSIFGAFERTATHEFSVEIDPTEASTELLDTLVEFGLNRASIGVQDFAEHVQDAIGRPQNFEQTARVVTHLRAAGVPSINMDLLYGLPTQTHQSFHATINQVLKMRPDRLAIYGYAHVPWMSKRQVMINEADLPKPITRFELAEIAQRRFVDAGYGMIGIDHFALATDSLFDADARGQLRRNFQGYTDDTADTLIGFGASAISKFREGFIQNAPSTSAYQERIADTGFAGHKGYVMSDHDLLVAQMVEDLMCRFAIDDKKLMAAFPDQETVIRQTVVSLMNEFQDLLFIGKEGLMLRHQAYALVRIIAKRIDDFTSVGESHSAAV
ncbi:Oxygen-independent coproporphyrinogen-III oxidase [Nereida ignava]|uniref:Coproporphyrinogen-III oxidase n=1 Tax=Nereida ignava TaxID=282199 RepID=A0A0U1NJR0_9RHOB|nr:oxygen-independent coproporphyrinogen III oxidase [Nereida ignava]CRK74972.1 Oxygen-independent coproporphyrinogen-III oxidase [Nereida ignava]SFJ05359.1 oxygen-independent coproporphyrinogen-3 oxidase [Nereida ignava DSM 16309]